MKQISEHRIWRDFPFREVSGTLGKEKRIQANNCSTSPWNACQSYALFDLMRVGLNRTVKSRSDCRFDDLSTSNHRIGVSRVLEVWFVNTDWSVLLRSYWLESASVLSHSWLVSFYPSVVTTHCLVFAFYLCCTWGDRLVPVIFDIC